MVVEGPRVTVELVEEAVEVSVEVTLLRTGLSCSTSFHPTRFVLLVESTLHKSGVTAYLLVL